MSELCNKCNKERISIGLENKCLECMINTGGLIHINKLARCGYWNGAYSVIYKITPKNTMYNLKLNDIFEGYCLWKLEQKTPIDEVFPKTNIYNCTLPRDNIFKLYYQTSKLNNFNDLYEAIINSGPTQIYKETEEINGWNIKYNDIEVDSLWNYIQEKKGFCKGIKLWNINYPYLKYTTGRKAEYIIYMNNENEYYMLHFY